MTYSYTQISQYLRWPRSYRHRYLDGWKEKETRAALLFGRCFEKALAAYFLREDSAAVLFKEWGAYRETTLDYANGGESWDRMARQGVQVLEPLARDNRIRIRQPRRNLQVKLVRALSSGNDFVAYIDALGYLDGTRCLIEWKTTASRYPEEPEGLLALDPQDYRQALRVRLLPHLLTLKVRYSSGLVATPLLPPLARPQRARNHRAYT